MTRILSLILLIFAISTSQEWTSAKFQTGTEYLHFKKPNSAVVYTCFDPTAYAEIVDAQLNYALLDSLNNINEVKYQKCTENDSLNNKSKNELKIIADTAVARYGETANKLDKERIRKYIWAATTGVFMGLVGFVGGVWVSN